MCKSIQLSKPSSTDGASVNRLISSCPPLDTNSIYCNLLQCDHFSDTSVIAKADNRALGFVSGYYIPSRPDTFFIWQVAVDESQRGTGLATRMLHFLSDKQKFTKAHFIETTITADNKASWALFTRFAERLNTELTKTEYYTAHEHFKGVHSSEWLVRIGPIFKSDTGDTNENF